MSCEQLIDTLLKTCDIKCKSCGEVQTIYSDLLSHLKKCQKVTLKYNENQELIAEKTKSWFLSKIIEDNLKISLQNLVTQVDETVPEKRERKKLRKNSKPVKEGSNTDDEKITKKLEEIRKKSEVEFTYKKKELLEKLGKLSKEPMSSELPSLRLHVLYHYGVDRWEKFVKSHYSQLVKSGVNPVSHFTSIELRVLNKVSPISVNIEEDIKNFEKALYSYHKKSTKTFSPSLLLDYRMVLLPVVTVVESYFETITSHFLWIPSQEGLHFYVKTEDSWNLDWGLEITILNLYQDVLGYLTSLFRNKYIEVFSDNYYRSNFIEYFKDVESDLKQLLTNLSYASDYTMVERDFQQMVKKHCKGEFGANERIPMGAIPKKETKLSFSRKEIFEKLFDSINEEEIKEFKKKLETLNA